MRQKSIHQDGHEHRECRTNATGKDCTSSRPCAVLLFFSVALLSTARQVDADAWLERMLETKSHDFGTVSRGDATTFRFPVRNIYQHAIQLNGVRSSCGCAAASLDKSVLAPKEIGYVVAEFNTRSFRGPHRSQLTLEASWDDNGIRRTGEANISVLGTIRSPVSVEPNEITFANVPSGTSAEQSVRISAPGDSLWDVKTVQCSRPILDVKLTDPSRSPEEIVYDMLVRLSPHAPTGHLREQVVVVPTNVHEPQVPVFVTGRVVGHVWASPEALLVGDLPAGSQVSKKIVVRSRVPCEIRKATSNGTELEFRVKSLKPLVSIVQVLLPVGNKIGPLRQSITLTTNDGHTTEVPVYANVVPTSQTAQLDRQGHRIKTLSKQEFF